MNVEYLQIGAHDGVVVLTGELDGACRQFVIEQLKSAAGAGSVVVDLAGLHFMDCGGYGALLTARQALAKQGRTLLLRNAGGQPAKLLRLIATTEMDGSAVDGSGIDLAEAADLYFNDGSTATPARDPSKSGPADVAM